MEKSALYFSCGLHFQGWLGPFLFWKANFMNQTLRGPVAILFHIAGILAAIVSQNSFGACGVSHNYRYVANWGIRALMCPCETKCQGGGIAPFWRSANLPAKVSRNVGYRSDSIAVSRDMGPLRPNRAGVNYCKHSADGLQALLSGCRLLHLLQASFELVGQLCSEPGGIRLQRIQLRSFVRLGVCVCVSLFPHRRTMA